MASNVKIGPKPIGAIGEGNDDQADEYLGFLTFSTTGEVIVPREWLLEEFEKQNIPKSLAPRSPSHWSAYRRGMSKLLDDPQLREYLIWNKQYSHDFDCKLEIEKSDEGGSNVFICYAKVFWPEDIIGEEGGDWKTTRLGYFDFHRPETGPSGLVYETDIDDDNVHHDRWEKVIQRAKTLFKTMKTHHNFADLQTILENFREVETNAVAIRRAVYFVGAHHENVVRGLSNIWIAMNQFKEDGEEMRIDITPVVNLEDQRELIADRVRNTIEEMIDNVVSQTMQEWEDEEHETAEEAAREIMDQIGESEAVASEYNQLLSMRLSIKDILRDRMGSFAEDQEEIMERVLEQTTFDDV